MPIYDVMKTAHFQLFATHARENGRCSSELKETEEEGQQEEVQ